MRHETNVTKVPLDELKTVFAERADRKARERFVATDEEVFFAGLSDKTLKEMTNELMQAHLAEGGDSDGGWRAVCSCGWEANNPVPAEHHANEAAEAHLTAIYGE